MTNPVGYEGEPLTLVTGRVVHVKYGMRGLMRLEQEFGSLGAVQTAISTDGSGMVFTPAMSLLACGMLFEAGTSQGLLTDVDVLADLIDPAEFQVAVSAAGRALKAAFPQAAQDAAPTKRTRAKRSPGPTGITSASSSSDDPTASSGA